MISSNDIPWEYGLVSKIFEAEETELRRQVEDFVYGKVTWDSLMGTIIDISCDATDSVVGATMETQANRNIYLNISKLEHWCDGYIAGIDDTVNSEHKGE